MGQKQTLSFNIDIDKYVINMIFLKQLEPIILLAIMGPRNMSMGCWELNLNLSLLAQGMCIPWLNSQGSQNKCTLLSNLMFA